MEYVDYEKPRMRVVDLRSEQAIAGKDGPCMPQASHGKLDFYYDIAGDGYFKILLENENCSGNNYKLVYVDNPNIPGEATDEAKAAAAKAIADAMSGGGKQKFTGAAPIPDPAWS